MPGPGDADIKNPEGWLIFVVPIVFLGLFTLWIVGVSDFLAGRVPACASTAYVSTAGDY